MSLVGTRPILQDELLKYELHHRARIAIKPGITGMWQVSGRSDITDFEEVVRLDTEYISNWNFGLDIKILFKTVMTVLKREGSVWRKSDKVRTWNVREHKVERILVLLVMCLLVEDGLNDVCSFNEVHTPTNVYSTNHNDVASSKRACFAHYIGCWNWLHFTAIWTVNARYLYKTLNFWPLWHKIGTTFSEVMRKWRKTGENNKNPWAYH